MLWNFTSSMPASTWNMALIGKEILKKYADTKELQEDCINAQLMKNNMRRVMADAIYMAYVVQGARLTINGTAAETSFPM